MANPVVLRLARRAVWLMVPVIGKVLLPGTRVMSLILVVPTKPCWAVETLRVTLP
jgi:hypothetical protein